MVNINEEFQKVVESTLLEASKIDWNEVAIPIGLVAEEMKINYTGDILANKMVHQLMKMGYEPDNEKGLNIFFDANIMIKAAYRVGLIMATIKQDKITS